MTLFTPDEVARRLRVSSRTVRRLCASDQLEAVRVGRALRLPEHALAQYLPVRGDRQASYIAERRRGGHNGHCTVATETVSNRLSLVTCALANDCGERVLVGLADGSVVLRVVAGGRGRSILLERDEARLIAAALEDASGVLR